MLPSGIPTPVAAATGETADLLLALFVIFASAKLAAEIFERLKQPAVVGEILAGVVIGPRALGWVEISETTSALAEIGVILLLFTVGLEVKPAALFKVGGRALAVAVGGVVLPFLAGWGLMALYGAPTVEGVFMGAAMVATSVGITARVLAAMGLLHLETSQIILAAAVIDDILGLLVLGVVSSLSKGELDVLDLSLTAGLSIGLTLFMVFFGTKLARTAKPAVDRLRVGQAYFIAAMVLCLGFSLLATEAGVAPIIGAFLAGMALSEVADGTDLHHEVGTVTEFLVPFFLVSIGLQLDLAVFADRSVMVLAVLTTLIAVVTKLVGCGAAAWPLGRRAALQVGMGMVPRGEVGIIVAQVGLSLGVLTNALYAVVVFMAVVTTLVAPPFLTRLYAGEQRHEADEHSALESNDLW
jgi:Kef-type K+ transport system membrane component KefB